MSENDFYIGYLPDSPESQGRFTRRIVIVLILLVLAVLSALIFGQERLPAANFEFGTIRHFEGTIKSSPYPTLVAPDSRYLLVAPGKHGADELVRDFAGKNVSLGAKRISRDGRTMLEVMPGSLINADGRALPESPDVELGNVSLVGEVVDSKCYTGVMNPGSGKVHRDCAARCISGGVPPLLLAKNNKGDAELYQLAARDGKPLSKEIVPMVAQPVTIEGKAFRRGSTLLLHVEKITPVAEVTIRGWSCPRRRSN